MSTLSFTPESEAAPALLTKFSPRTARSAWLFFVAVALALLPFRAVVTYRDYATICTFEPCAEYQLDATGLASLTAWGMSPHSYAAIGVAQLLVLAVTLFVLAGLLIWKRPSERMPVLMAFVFVALGVTFFGNDAWPTYPAWRWPEQMFWFIQAASLVPLFCLFPDGRFPNRLLKWIALATIPPNLIYFSGNDPSIGSLQFTLFGIFVNVSFLMVIVVLIYRYRYVSTPMQRQQTKWILYGTALNMGILIVTGLVGNFLLPSAGHGTLLDFMFDAVRFAAILFNFACFTIALLRYRLYDVDVLINRTLVYGILTAGTMGVYVIMVGGFGALLPAQQGQPAAFILASGLVLIMIRPLHTQLQNTANRLIPPPTAPNNKRHDIQEAPLIHNSQFTIHNSLFRLLWLTLTAISLLWFAANVPAFYRQVAAVPNTPGWYAAVTSGLDVVFVALCAAVSLTIFRHRSNEAMAWLTAGTLVVWGVFNGLLIQSNQALGVPEKMGGLLGLVGGALAFAGYMSWMLFFYLFPSGQFAPRWTRFAALAWVLFSGSWILWPTSPYTPPQWPGWLIGPVVLVLWGSFLAAQIIRYRRVSTPVERQQTKWVLYGIAVAVLVAPPVWLGVGTVFETPLADWPRHLFVQAAGNLGIAAIPLTIGVAILRRRLFDIDLLINRSLVYGSLTAITVGIYVLLVGGAGSLLQQQGSAAVAFVATGVVAVLFQPLRARLQTAVDRLMFGQRDDPVGMLAHLAHRLETVDAPQAILPALVETIAVALKLPYVALQTAQPDGRWETMARFGRPVDQAKHVPLLYQSRDIGRLLIAPRSPGEEFSPADERLLATIAPLTAATLQAVQLSDALQVSRRELVTSREEERRRLRRDLHDGLGPVLASVALQADTARELVDGHPAETKRLLASIMNEAQTAVADIRRLVYGLRPPALDELGLVKALHQSSRGRQLRVTVETPAPLPSLPAAVEVAAYRIAQEAINNAGRHGQARNCTVTLAVDDGLHLTITDDGTGLPPDARSGVGLISMRERVAELGGTFAIQALPAGGTQIKARLPID